MPVAAVGAQTLSVDDPDIVTLVGLSVSFSPAGAVAVSWTVPAKPPCDVTVIVAALHCPWTTLIGPLLVMVKSCTLNVTWALWTRLLLVPVTVMMNVPPLGKLHDSVAVPLPVMLAGDRVQCVVSLEVRLTTPPNPLMAVIVTVELPATFGVVLIGVVADIWKSTTRMVIVWVV